jgi:hypothetical protein
MEDFMENVYLITHIHSVLLTYLGQVNSLSWVIKDNIQLSEQIGLSVYADDSAPVKFCEKQNVTLVNEYDRINANMVNAVTMRDIINVYNDTELISFISDYFCPYIQRLLEAAKSCGDSPNEIFKLAEDVAIREHRIFVDNFWDSSPLRLEKILGIDYLEMSVLFAKRRWLAFRHYGVSLPFATVEEYMLFDCCFGIGDLLVDMMGYNRRVMFVQDDGIRCGKKCVEN